MSSKPRSRFIHRRAAQIGLGVVAAFVFAPRGPARSDPVAELSRASAAGDEALHEITVSVRGLHSGDGRVLALLFSSSDGFPGKTSAAHAKALTKDLSGGRATLVFSDVPPGTYAAAVVHDENSNGKLDTNFLGIPKEGVGASNRAPERMGPPLWRHAKFVVTGATGVEVEIHYF